MTNKRPGKSRTAVIYFSLSPWKEAQQKSFVSKGMFYENFRIAGLLRSHSKREIEQAGLPFFIFDERNQEGKTFGEKFVSAFEKIFQKGYDHVIAVGNDTPKLQSHHILKASEMLEQGMSDVVIGPATDGGTWLMGFDKDTFSPKKIKCLDWNSGKLLTSIFEQLSSALEISLLEKFDDVDDEEDLKRFLENFDREKFLCSLKKNIREILGDTQFGGHAYKLPKTCSGLSYNFLLRAPPATTDLLF